VVRQLTDGEDDDDRQNHPSHVRQSTHALYARLLLVPVLKIRVSRDTFSGGFDFHHWVSLISLGLKFRVVRVKV